MQTLIDPERSLGAGGFSRKVAGGDFDAIVEASKMAAQSHAGILLYGITGCGKSLAVRCLAPKSGTCRWIDCFDPVQIGWLSDEGIFDRLITFVIDDLGSEQTQNDYGIHRLPVAQFIMRLCRRHEHGIEEPRLFVTTNLSAEVMSERYGDRMMSRLLSLVVPVSMTGTDHRPRYSVAGTRK